MPEYSSVLRCCGSSLSDSLLCSQKYLQILPQDICHAHFLRIRVKFIQILFRAGGVELQSGKKCFRTDFVAAADHVANCALKVIYRHFVPSGCVQRSPAKIKQLRLDVIDFALVFDCCRYRVIGRHCDRMLKGCPIRNAMKEQGSFVGKMI